MYPGGMDQDQRADRAAKWFPVTIRSVMWTTRGGRAPRERERRVGNCRAGNWSQDNPQKTASGARSERSSGLRSRQCARSILGYIRCFRRRRCLS